MANGQKRIETNSWEQQPGESARAFEAFAVYRDMGPERSVRRVAQQLGKSGALISRWSSAHNWVERARAYDRELDQQARAQAVRDVRGMTDRHIQIAMRLQEKALEALERLDVKALTPKMQLEFLTKATELERLNRISAAGMDGTVQTDGADEIEIVIEGEDDADGQS